MSTFKPSQGTGNLTTFNIQHGFAEALLRGMRSSFLADTDYHHLTQCETLDDIRLNLSETDYADGLADFNSLTPNTLQKAAVTKVCKQKANILAMIWIISSDWP
jgi:V-type H+-transporting ATPase subunit d